MGNVAADLIVHVGADIGDATKGLSDIGSKVDSTGGKFRTASMVMAGGAAAVIGGLGAAVYTAGSFEQAMADVNAVADLTGNQFDQLSALALQIGKDTAFSATEGAQAIGELAKAGVSVADILNGAAAGAANLAAAGGISIPEAATTMSNALNMFSLSGKDAAMVADTFAAAANASAADVGDLAMGLAQGGPMAASFGISLQDTTTALALFSNYGIRGSDAGTSLKTMLQRLANPADDAAQLMGQLGIQAFDAQGNFVGLSALSGQLNAAFKNLSPEARNAALSIIFGSDASRVASIMAKEGADGFDEMGKKVKDSGAASRMAAKRMDTLFGSIEQLKGSLETAMIAIGSGMVPVIRRMSDGVTGAVNWFLQLSPAIQKFVGYAMGVVGVALAIGAAFTGFIGFFGPAIAGFMALLTPIGLLVAVITGLYIAWQTNFLGIRDILSNVFGAIGPIFDQLANYLELVNNSTGKAGKALALMPGWLQPIANFLGVTVDATRELINAWNENGLQGVLDAFPEQLGRVGRAFAGIGEALWGWVQGIDWAGVGTAIWNGLTTAFGYIGDVTGTIVSKLGDLTAALATWVWEKASAVPWGTILSLAAGLAGDITGTIVSKLGDLTTALSNWLTGAAGQIPWSTIASGAQNITGDIIAKIGNLGASLKTWYDGAIQSVDWGNLGVQAGQAVGNLAQTLAPKAAELITGFANAIRTNWQTIGKVLLGLIVGLPAAIGYIGLTFAPKALEFLQGFVTGLGINWQTVANWFISLPGKLLAAIPSLVQTLAPKALELLQSLITGLEAQWPSVSNWLAQMGPKALTAVGNLANILIQRGTELIRGVSQGLSNQWPTVVSWLGQMGPKALTAVGNLASTLLSRGVELITGVISGLNQQWPSARAWLALVGTLAFGAVGSLARTLWDRGVQLISGLRDGWSNRWAGVVGELQNIGPAVVGAVGDLGSVLWNAGADLIGGLIGGIQSMIPSLSDVLGGITGLIPDWKGPEDVDKKLLTPSGEWLMEGLIGGIDKMIPEVRSTLQGFTSDLASEGLLDFSANRPKAAAANVQAGQTVIYQSNQFDVHVDELEDVVEAARFVRDIDTHRTLYFAGATA